MSRKKMLMLEQRVGSGAFAMNAYERMIIAGLVVPPYMEQPWFPVNQVPTSMVGDSAQPHQPLNEDGLTVIRIPPPGILVAPVGFYDRTVALERRFKRTFNFYWTGGPIDLFPHPYFQTPPDPAHWRELTLCELICLVGQFPQVAVAYRGDEWVQRGGCRIFHSSRVPSYSGSPQVCADCCNTYGAEYRAYVPREHAPKPPRYILVL
jgi:hypothetical protein